MVWGMPWKRKMVVLKNGLQEESLLIWGLLKWTLLAGVIGTVIGVVVGIFLKLIDLSISVGANYSWRIFLLPVGGLFSGWLIFTFAPDAVGHGTEAVIEAIHTRFGRIRAAVVPIKALATIITLGTWGSAGKEGPAAQIGSGIASLAADLLHLAPQDRRKLAVCGISAGFAAVFGLPITGSIFGIEVLSVGGMFYEYLLPSFVAGIAAFNMAAKMGMVHHLHFAFTLPSMSEITLLKLFALGGIFGLISVLFIETLKAMEALFRRLPMARLWRPLLGGFCLLLLVPLASKQYLGLSTALLDQAVQGGEIANTAFLWKILFTAITLGSGGSGGVITPLFVIGSTAGNMFGPWFGFARPLGAVLGMLGLVAGSANTPIAGAIMGIEFLGPRFGVFAVAISIASYLIVGHRSVYPSQILVCRKTEAVRIKINVPIAHRFIRVGNKAK